MNHDNSWRLAAAIIALALGACDGDDSSNKKNDKGSEKDNTAGAQANPDGSAGESNSGDKEGTDRGGSAGSPADDAPAEEAGGTPGSAGADAQEAAGSGSDAGGAPPVERGEGRDAFGFCPSPVVCTGFEEYQACFNENCASYNTDCYFGLCAPVGACITTCDCGDLDCEAACATAECTECMNDATACATESDCVSLLVCGPPPAEGEGGQGATTPAGAGASAGGAGAD